MPEPITPEQLENATRMAAKVVETFGDDWQLRYDPDGDEVSCRTDDEGPIEGSFMEVFSTSQWPSDSDHSPVAEFLCASIVMVPRLVGEVERLKSALAQEGSTSNRLLDERDDMEKLLDTFAYTIAPEEVIGEHSSGNDPWENALDLLTPAAEVDRLRAAVDLLGGQLQGGAQAAKDLARVIDVVALEIRRAVRLASAGDLAAAMEVVTDFASEADWLDDLDAESDASDQADREAVDG